MRMVMSMVIYKMQKPTHSFHPDNKYTTIFLGSAPRVIVINSVSRRYKKRRARPRVGRTIRRSVSTGNYRSSMGFLPKVPLEFVVRGFVYFRMTCQVDWFATSASREMVPLGRL